MTDKPQGMSPKARRRIILLNSAGPLGGMLIAWAIYGAHALFGIDLVRSSRNQGNVSDPSTVYLIMAVLAAIVGPLVAVVLVRKALSLAHNGVEVIGEVTRIGMLSKYRMVRADCRYDYEGKAFTYAWSHSSDVEGDLSKGDSVVLIVDPKNPKRCMRKEEIFPEKK